MKRLYIIDHRILFLFGYVFYLSTPYIVGVTNIFQGFPGMDLYQQFFALIPRDKLMVYALITLAWLPAFYLGHFCFTLVRPVRQTLSLFPATPVSQATRYIGFLLVLVLCLFAFLARGSLGGGYSSYDVGARGKLSTLLVIFNFFLLYQLVSRQTLSWWLVGGLSVTALLLLSMGGRMYVFQTLVILLVYKTSFAPKRWGLRHISLFLAAAFLIGAGFGLWRMNASFGINKAAYSFLAEPVFTWFSTSTFLTANDIPAFNMPWNFITSFLNLIPNTVISFQPYVVPAAKMGYVYQSPLGADSIWTNLVINFGSVGSVLFLFVMGFLLNFLRYLSARHRFGAVYYILVCGLLPFQFFRDGFYILHKQLYFNFLLLPGLILLLIKTVIYTQQYFKVLPPAAVGKEESL